MATADRSRPRTDRSLSVHGACDFARLLINHFPDTLPLLPRIDVHKPVAVHKAPPPIQTPEAPEAPEEPTCCFVCLETEGPMLVNTCACRWLHVHPKCLDRVLENNCSGTCSVCKSTIVHERKVKPTALTVMWESHTLLLSMFAIANVVICIVGAVYVMGGLFLVGHAESSAGDPRRDPSRSAGEREGNGDVPRCPSIYGVPSAALGFVLVVYAMSTLHALFADGWPQACPCRPPGVSLVGEMLSTMESGQRRALGLGPNA